MDPWAGKSGHLGYCCLPPGEGFKPLRVIKGIAGVGGEAAVPHQFRVEGVIDDERRAPLIAGALPARTDNVIVADANGNRLRVTEAVAGGVTPGATVVVP